MAICITARFVTFGPKFTAAIGEVPFAIASFAVVKQSGLAAFWSGSLGETSWALVLFKVMILLVCWGILRAFSVIFAVRLAEVLGLKAVTLRFD